MSPGLRKKWILQPSQPERVMNLARDTGLDSTVVSVLLSRGIKTSRDIKSFLNPSVSDLLDPFGLKEMDRAVDRIERAVRQSEKVVVFGDYDVDGVTSTTLLLDYFEERGLAAGYYIPDRVSEGYGLNEEAMRELHRRGTDLIITADCGTTAVKEISLARDLGMDVIVVDHHEVPPDLPPATALLNPKRPDSDYGQTVLCTAGLAFKLVQALSGKVPHALLDLVALGTIADVSPLRDENRYLVKEGLKILSRSPRPGVEALKEVSSLREPTVGTGTVGFKFGPRINAAGRMGTASPGVELLRSKTLERARKIARDLDFQNRKRQEVERVIWEEAEKAWRNRPENWGDHAIVLAFRQWHPGVIGIVAARLAERFHRPAILLAIGADGVAKGSARSIPGFNLFAAISRCQDILLGFGGHRAAAGLSIQVERIPDLRKLFSSAVSDLIEPDGFRPRQNIDATVRWEDLSQNLARVLEDLQPFGMGNPEPSLMLSSVVPVAPRIVGGTHLKFSVRKAGEVGGPLLDVIGFRMGDRLADLGEGSVCDLVFVPEINVWQGRKKLQLRLKDFRSAKADTPVHIEMGALGKTPSTRMIRPEASGG